MNGKGVSCKLRCALGLVSVFPACPSDHTICIPSSLHALLSLKKYVDCSQLKSNPAHLFPVIFLIMGDGKLKGRDNCIPCFPINFVSCNPTTRKAFKGHKTCLSHPTRPPTVNKYQHHSRNKPTG